MLQQLLEQTAAHVGIARPGHQHLYHIVIFALGPDKQHTSGTPTQSCDRIFWNIRFTIIFVPANAMICRMPIAIQKRMECFAHVDVLTYTSLQAVLLQRAQEQ